MRNFIKRYVSALTDKHGQMNDLRVGAVDAGSDFGASIQLSAGDQFAVLPQHLVQTLRDDLAAWAETPREGAAQTYEYTPPTAWFTDAEPLKTFCVRRGDDGWGYCLEIGGTDVVLTETQATDLASVITARLAGQDGFRPEQSRDEVIVQPRG